MLGVGNVVLNLTLKRQFSDERNTQSSIDFYTQVLKEVDSELQHSVL